MTMEAMDISEIIKLLITLVAIPITITIFNKLYNTYVDRQAEHQKTLFENVLYPIYLLLWDKPEVNYNECKSFFDAVYEIASNNLQDTPLPLIEKLQGNRKLLSSDGYSDWQKLYTDFNKRLTSEYWRTKRKLKYPIITLTISPFANHWVSLLSTGLILFYIGAVFMVIFGAVSNPSVFIIKIQDSVETGLAVLTIIFIFIGVACFIIGGIMWIVSKLTSYFKLKDKLNVSDKIRFPKKKNHKHNTRNCEKQ